MDVISEVLHISSNSQSLMSCSARYECLCCYTYFLVVCIFICRNVYFRKDIANKLLERLGDEEIMIREQASKLLPMIG